MNAKIIKHLQAGYVVVEEYRLIHQGNYELHTYVVHLRELKLQAEHSS